MFFGEYLVVKNVINETQLLDALMYQVEHLPSFMRVLREEEIVSSKELFRLIKIQMETNSDLITVLRDENIIDESQLHHILSKQVSNRKMLGEVLVELQITDQAKVEDMLCSFLRDKDNLQSLKREQLVETVKKVAGEVEISDAALESLRELGMVMDDAPVTKKEIPVAVEATIFVEEFLNIFNSKMKMKLTKILEILKQSVQDDSDISNYFNSLYRDLHVIKGAAQVAELVLIDSVVSEWEKTIEKVLKMQNAEIKSWCNTGLGVLEESIQQLWVMREAVDIEKTDANIKPATALLKEISSL